jgi:ATP citrate (pro-S)-lyase
MLNIDEIRNNPGNILALGSYRPGYQAVLDFDRLCGRSEPSIVCIITAGKRFEKYFWGNGEVLIPCYPTLDDARRNIGNIDWLLNMSSGRRTLASTKAFFETFPDALGAHLFAEDVPEKHAIEIYDKYQENGKCIIGPAGVGLIVPGSLKLGVVGGVDWRQIQASRLHLPGNVAILSASGGMINEIITMTARSQHEISFALCFGGDRWPTTQPYDAFLTAEKDPNTKYIIYYGELGGQDEYKLADLLKSGQVTKPVIAYIAGIIGETFDQPVQFGHAKALANEKSETASAKRQALKEAGVQVANSMTEFSDIITDIPQNSHPQSSDVNLANRQHSLFSSTISTEYDKGYAFTGLLLQDWASKQDIALQITSALLGRQPKSTLTSDLVRTIFLLSVDHGPQVSGALNTIITARAGKGIVDSLAAGLMTIGPRFGGAVSGAAREWFDGANAEITPSELVEERAKARQYIQGIGHKKYRLDLPDPRTAILADFAKSLSSSQYFTFAKEVEAITTTKKGNLILNVDGHIAALMLDVLENEEKISKTDISRMISADFFNALFIIPRIVGFTAHYLDQKRIDEGLFRLPDDAILLA